MNNDNRMKMVADVINKMKSKKKEDDENIFNFRKTTDQMIVDAANRVSNENDKELIEGWGGALRVSSIVASASSAKSHGDKSAQSFKKAASVLGGQRSDKSVNERLDDIEEALYQLASGLEQQRLQVGSLVSINTIGHLLSAKQTQK